MMLGLSFGAFTILHVVISLVAIVAGLIAVTGMLRSHRMRGWTALFLVATVLTSVTGFMFPFTRLLPSHITGLISIAVLIPTLLGVYVFGLHGPWRWIYVAGALMSLYLNVFVGVVQSFQKLGVLHTLAPTQSEPPFLIAQAIVLALFVGLGVIAVRRFHPERLAMG